MFGIEHFIFISSSHVYKIPENYGVSINVNYKKEPQDYYGQSKLEAEKILLKKNKLGVFGKLHKEKEKIAKAKAKKLKK